MGLLFYKSDPLEAMEIYFLLTNSAYVVTLFLFVSFGCLVCCLHLLIWMLFTKISQIATIVIVLVFVPSLFFCGEFSLLCEIFRENFGKRKVLFSVWNVFFPSKFSLFLQFLIFGGRKNKKKRNLYFVCLLVCFWEKGNQEVGLHAIWLKTPLPSLL